MLIFEYCNNVIIKNNLLIGNVLGADAVIEIICEHNKKTILKHERW